MADPKDDRNTIGGSRLKLWRGDMRTIRFFAVTFMHLFGNPHAPPTHRTTAGGSKISRGEFGFDCRKRLTRSAGYLHVSSDQYRQPR
jgi:hypothetical protein